MNLQTLMFKLEEGIKIKIASAISSFDPVTSGLQELDDLLGGGLSRGAIMEFWGSAASGKTAFSYLYMMNVDWPVYIDVSNCHDRYKAERMGLPHENLIYSNLTKADEIIQFVKVVVLLDLVDVIVIDDLASVDEGNYNAHDIRTKLLDAIQGTRTAILLLNQVRQKPYGKEYSYGDGRCLYVQETSVSIQRLGGVRRKGERAGSRVRLTVEKCRRAPMRGKSDEFYILWDGIQHVDASKRNRKSTDDDRAGSTFSSHRSDGDLL